MIKKRRAGGPRGLATTLPHVMKTVFRSRGFAETGVLTDWPDIVGRPLADFTSPERLTRDGTLQVRVAGGWALEVTHLEPVLLDRIASYYGYRAVVRLALMQGPLPPREEPRRRPVRALDAGEEAALRNYIASADIAGADEPTLRAALERLGRAVIGAADGHGNDGSEILKPGTKGTGNGA